MENAKLNTVAVELEDGATYRVRFPNSDDPRDGAEYLNILHHSGYWISPNDGDMGPISVALADYEVVEKVDGAQFPDSLRP